MLRKRGSSGHFYLNMQLIEIENEAEQVSLFIMKIYCAK
jgi:hypothetical protein